MYSLCCRYVKSKTEAEDVLVMAFSKIFERINQYKGEGSFEGWIRKVIVNESLTYLRKNKNMYLETDIEAADREPDYAQLENQLEAEDLLKMIDSLPTGYRIVFNLYAIDGYSHKEIATYLGISENTSKSQLSRARALLQRNCLELENDIRKVKN
jgi:RNA polymerase sigma-70 factor (ECF subfamily)